MAAGFELNKNDKGQFSFSLKAGNGEPILRSEQYNTKAAAKNGIASVQKNSQLDARFDKKEAKDGRTYFNLKAGNHQVIGTSQMYNTPQSRDAGVASVKTNGKTDNVKDNT